MSAARPPISPVVARLLVDPENESKIERVLLAYGWPGHEVEDGRQDVYVKVVRALGRGHPAPEDLRAMKAFCAEVARNHAIDRQRRAKKWERYLHENVEPDEYCALEYGAEQRDPVDAGRQLEVLGQLFAGGKMPEHGVEKRAVLVSLLQQLRMYVQSIADANPENGLSIVESAGMALKKPAVRKPRVFAALPGATSGTVKIVAPSAGHRASYEWQYSLDGGKTWVDIAPTLQAKTSLSGLTSGTPLEFRYRWVLKTGASDWSVPVTVTVK